jgi:hypothetical protein
MNLMDRAVGILLPYLVMANPKVTVNTKHLDLRHQAYTTELALDNLLEEIKFAELTLRRAILNSLFGWGIVKTGIMKSHEVEILGFTHDVGQSYSDVIDDEDFVGDPSARTIEEMSQMGHNYLMDVDSAKEFFGIKHADHISGSYEINRSTSPDQITKPERLNQIRQYVKLTDHWIPDENIIITTLTEGDYKKILRTVNHDGIDTGPYDFLGYKWFPKHPIPIPPAWNWLEMDVLTNQVVNKMKLQAGRQKTIVAYESSAADDMGNIVNAKDGKTVRVDHVDGIKNIEMGGVNRDLYDWIQYLDGQFSTQGGNLYTIGGSSSQAETLGQEQMLFGNATKGLDDMTNTVYNFVRSIVQKHGYYMWTNPMQSTTVIKNIEGIGEVQDEFNAQGKSGDLTQYSMNIIPYSMQRMSPTAEYQRMLSFLSQWVLPTAQIAAQQGSQLNVTGTTKYLARKFNIENIDEIYISGEPQNADLNAYQPLVGTKGKKSPGQQDGRTGAQGAASRDANLAQQQNAQAKKG